MDAKSNALASLIGTYDSGDDSEEDSRTLQSSGQNSLVTRPSPISHCPWSACYDESTGYTYYWNQTTNEVTWEPPKEYLLALKVAAQHFKKDQTEVTAKEWSLYQKALLEKDQTKLQTSRTDLTSNPIQILSNNKRKAVQCDSDEEVKIEPISFYNKSDSESNDEEESPKMSKVIKNDKPKEVKKKVVKKKKVVSIVEYGPCLPPNQEYTVPIGPAMPPELVERQENKNNTNDDSQDEEILVSQIKAKAEILKKLGGELPSEVEHLIESPKVNQDVDDFLLEIENEIKQPKPLFPSAQNIKAGEQIVVKKVEKEIKKEVTPEPKEEPKKKSGLAKKMESYTTKYSQFIEGHNDVRSGLGFSTINESHAISETAVNGDQHFIGFTKGEVLNEFNDDSSKNDEYDLLEAKLKFLVAQVATALSPVQEMFVQLQTLLLARKSGALSTDYWRGFIKTTLRSINDLELISTPKGWITSFNREAGRYVYKRISDGYEQSDYPEMDDSKAVEVKTMNGNNALATSASDDMEICNTPPHVTEEEWSRSPSPPPPPHISAPVPPIPPAASISPQPPLPPLDVKQPKAAQLKDELESFYSDLATMEPVRATVTPPPPAALREQEKEQKRHHEPEAKEKPATPVVPKKKTKVKLTGIKNKGVSSMVAKWQQVQEEITSD